MAETVVLKGQRREGKGSRASQRLRDAGKLPAIVYGHNEEPVSIQLDYHDFMLELQHRHRLLAVAMDGTEHRFLIKEVQFDHLGDKVVHVDLARVDLHERVKVDVPVELKGQPKATVEGATVDHMLTMVELECVVTDIPERIRVTITDLEVGKTITAGDLQLPAGVTLVTAPETIVVAMRVVAEEAAAAAPAEGEAMEPEVITRAKPEAEEGEEAEK